MDALRPDVANVNRHQPPQRKDDIKENLYNTPNVQTPPMKTFYNKSTVGPYATTTLIAGNNMLNKNDNSAFRYGGFLLTACSHWPIGFSIQFSLPFSLPKSETNGYNTQWYRKENWNQRSMNTFHILHRNLKEYRNSKQEFGRWVWTGRK